MSRDSNLSILEQAELAKSGLPNPENRQKIDDAPAMAPSEKPDWQPVGPTGAVQTKAPQTSAKAPAEQPTNTPPIETVETKAAAAAQRAAESLLNTDTLPKKVPSDQPAGLAPNPPLTPLGMWGWRPSAKSKS